MGKGKTNSPKDLKLDDYVEGIRSGDRVFLARAITLVESRKAEHQELAQNILQGLLPNTGGSIRVGITGVPGVGKSTFIEALGTNLIEAGNKVAVLAVDPTSTKSGGSILGDKTRMTNLSQEENAFIRPSPTSGVLGGVGRVTRETLLLCEAAGFDVVLVETVGAGQSETVVSDMVDFFLVLMLPGGGDELQGIKKGMLELADMIAINKADGDNEKLAKRTMRDYKAALHILTPKEEAWQVPVLKCSALKNEGVNTLWREIEKYIETFSSSGQLNEKRRLQKINWMWSTIDEKLKSGFRSLPEVLTELEATESAVKKGELTAVSGAERLLDIYLKNKNS